MGARQPVEPRPHGTSLGHAAVPAGLNWDLWLGPREPRPFNPAYVPVAWRDFWDFGGPLEDFGCHEIDSSCWAFDWSRPRPSSSRRPATEGRHRPARVFGEYRFEARGRQRALTFKWYHGGCGRRARRRIRKPADVPRGVLYVGDKGRSAGAAGVGPRLLPESKFRNTAKPKPTLPRSKGHHRDWLDACKGGPPAGKPVRVRRPADRTGAPRRTVAPARPPHRLGRRADGGAGNPGCRADHQRTVPRGMGAQRIARHARHAELTDESACNLGQPVENACLQRHAEPVDVHRRLERHAGHGRDRRPDVFDARVPIERGRDDEDGERPPAPAARRSRTAIASLDRRRSPAGASSCAGASSGGSPRRRDRPVARRSGSNPATAATARTRPSSAAARIPTFAPSE